MPQIELTDNRPKNYSKWHRSPNLPEWCYLTDGDFFEQRKIEDVLKAIAYFETIQIPQYAIPEDYPIWDSKKALAEQISKQMDIPAYFVWHYPDCKIFFVNKLNSTNIIKMYEPEYINFLKNLQEKYNE